MYRLSGDQNGNAASSVPGKGCAVSESIGRTHSSVLPTTSLEVKARLKPSGEMAPAAAVLRLMTKVAWQMTFRP